MNTQGLSSISEGRMTVVQGTRSPIQSSLETPHGEAVSGSIPWSHYAASATLASLVPVPGFAAVGPSVEGDSAPAGTTSSTTHTTSHSRLFFELKVFVTFLK